MSNIDISTLVGLSSPPTAASTSSPLRQGLVGTWKGAGQVKENCCWKQERNRKRKENAFNLSTFTVLYQVQQNFECFLFSRTCLNTLHNEGCWLTANSNCPEAKGSHLQTGSFIFPWKRKWSLAMILNHPPAAVLQGHQGSPVTNTSAYLHVREGTVTWSARGTEGQVRWADKRWTEHSLSPRWKQNTRFIALSYGLCYSLTLQSGSEEFMWMWRRAALKGVTKEMAQGRWERTREGGRGREEEGSPGTEERGKSIHFSPQEGEVWRVRAVLLFALWPVHWVSVSHHKISI